MEYNKKQEDNCRFISADIKFFCGYLEKEFVVKAENFDGYEDESGNEGERWVDVKCECGKGHTLTIEKW